MHQIYFFARIYPYWALPLAFALGQVALYFRRRKHALQFPLWGLVGTFVLSSILWIAFRGDLNAEKWVRWLLN